MHPLLQDVVARATSLESTSASRRWQHAVLEASARTTHALAPSSSPRDPRYMSGDVVIDRLWLALADVADPELPISLVDLGLICDIRFEYGTVEVDVTFTATACPCMEFITHDIRERLLREADVAVVKVRDVWDPPWSTERMTQHGRALLRSFGVAA